MVAARASSSKTTNPPVLASEPPRTPSRSQTIVEALTGTSAACLVSPSPIPAHTTPPRYLYTPISPMKRLYTHLLNREPTSVLESMYQEALRESEARDQVRKQSVINLQAAVVLQGGYLDKVHQWMQGREQKEAGKKPGGKLVGDGLPRLLNKDEFIDEVFKHEQAQKRKAEEKEERKLEKERHTKALERWKEACKARDERVKAQKERYRQAALEEWEDERQLAKTEWRRIGWQKPMLGAVEKKPGRPKKRAAQRADEDGSDGEEQEDESEMDVDYDD
ncbi:hypothetical protein BD309DRAFT_872939 [Dichomitus squalens]|nr:hypothetical protein BD309DRAFT_872939 [Dichomitus squalens]